VTNEASNGAEGCASPASELMESEEVAAEGCVEMGRATIFLGGVAGKWAAVTKKAPARVEL
jgi:hypothetical protein